MTTLGTSRFAPRAGNGSAVAPAVFRPANSVRRSARERRAVLRGAVPVAIVVLVTALGYVWVQNRIVDVAYQLSAVRRLVDRLEYERRNLELEVATVESPKNLEAAGRRLGLGPPRWGTEVPLP